MIYQNGYIEEILPIDGGFDEQGRPVASEPIVGERVPCMYRAMTEDKRENGKDGKRSRGAYEVHVAPCAITAGRIRLYRRDGSLVGEFPVQSWSVAVLLNFTKIILG